ncbi:TRAP transporter small permease [Nisaea sp.]|uniref:TRAP transporter small permease n=1 Tax=Nisaea sp. TaxID=2024842 RepID=UPI003B52AC9B
MMCVDAILGRTLKLAACAGLAAIFVLVFANVVTRTLQIPGIVWFDEVVQGLFAWTVFLGAAALWRDDDHFQVDWLRFALPPAQARILRILTTLLGLAFMVIMTRYGLALTLKARALTPILDIPTSLLYAAIPVSGAIMAAYSAVRLFRLLTTRRNTR